MRRWESIAAIFAGRWQIPMAICAMAVAAFALYRMKPVEQDIPFDALLADVLTLAERGEYLDAADAATNLLELDPPLPNVQQAQLHDALADIIYKQELIRGIPNLVNTRLLLDHHQQAVAKGLRLDGHAALRAGQAHEWLGETESAIKAFRSVIARNADENVRRTALQGLVRLLDGKPECRDERRQYITALLDEQGASPGYLWWALQYAVRESLERDEPERARELLTDHARAFKRSDLKGYYDYLWAWINVYEGNTAQAIPLLDRVDQWLTQNPRGDTQLDQAGYLPALSAWLRGSIALAESRPQDALTYFTKALELQSHGDLLVAGTDGLASAMGLLERHAAARGVIRDTIKRLAVDPAAASVARPRLRKTILNLQRACREKQDFRDSIEYLELGLELTNEGDHDARLSLLEQLGHECSAATAFIPDPAERQSRAAQAARTLEKAADLAQSDEARHVTLLWESANLFDQAGLTAEARRMLTQFVTERTSDPRMPQALLRLGQACAADGLLKQAIDHYRQLIADYPTLEEASRARFLTAVCLAALGEEHYAEARGILNDLLEDEAIAPQAQVFRDTLFELCDLLYQQGEYAAAISRMEDFLVFYPEDPECYRIRFMLADAYRGSAYRLLEQESEASIITRRRISRERFQRAADLFGQYLQEVVRLSDDTPARELYTRLALFYRGDCLYELNEPETLAEALVTYRQAAARYQGLPAALTAQIQIANIHLRQGHLIEAARAIERARWILGNIPDQAFKEYDDMDRTAWDRYLTAVRSSNLFEEVFADTP